MMCHLNDQYHPPDKAARVRMKYIYKEHLLIENFLELIDWKYCEG